MADNLNITNPLFRGCLEVVGELPQFFRQQRRMGQMPFVHSWFLFLAHILTQAIFKYDGLGVVPSGAPGAPPPTAKSKIKLTLTFCKRAGVGCERINVL